MDMRIYYTKIHSIEQSLPDDWNVVISLDTPEGGKAGMPSEVTRRNAARLIADGRARVATDDEAKAFRQSLVEAKRTADDAAAASRIQVTLVPSTDLQSLKAVARPVKA